MDTVRTLLIINSLNSLCAGIIAPVLTTHIIANGGSQISSGFMITGIYIAEKRSKDFLALFEHGNKFRLYFTFVIVTVTNLVLVFATSHLLIIFCVLLHTLTNRTRETCRTLLESQGDEVKQKSGKLLDATSLAAFSMGCILGGHIFVRRNIFMYNAMLNTILSVTALMLSQSLPGEIEQPEPTDENRQYTTLCTAYRARLNKLLELDYRHHWDILMLLIAYTCCFRVFNTKFAFMVTSNYCIGTVVLGYTIAYQHMMTFLANTLITHKGHRIDKRRIFDSALLFCSFSLIGVYYAPSYDAYLFLFFPMICSHVLVNHLMGECLTLDDNGLVKNFDTIVDIINVVTPMMFGFVAEAFGAHGFNILGVLPIVVCIFIVNRCIIKEEIAADKED